MSTEPNTTETETELTAGQARELAARILGDTTTTHGNGGDDADDPRTVAQRILRGY